MKNKLEKSRWSIQDGSGLWSSVPMGPQAAPRSLRNPQRLHGGEAMVMEDEPAVCTERTGPTLR